jgi:hypothetical protein
MGKFKKKYAYCKQCKQNNKHWEEKETDVHIATKIVEDAFTDKFDNTLLITADTDLMPPINSVRSFHQEKTIAVIATPKRMALCRSLSPIYEIMRSKLSENLLLAEGVRIDGSIAYTRPTQYDPPAK